MAVISRFATVLFLALLFAAAPAQAQQEWADPPSSIDPRIQRIIEDVSAERIEEDVRTLVGFGTRHTLSDTASATRGIGAARRWVHDEFQRISERCGGCLDVRYQRFTVSGEERIPEPTEIVNVLAVQRGTVHPNRYLLMTAHLDSRVSDVMDAESDAPGANDNASGVAAVLEAARVLSQYDFGSTIVYAALSGEEQGLFGGEHLAQTAKEEGWNVAGVLNNDVIGNIHGIDRVIDNTVFPVFSGPFAATATERELRRIRYFGGAVDGPSRQLARYVDRITNTYMDLRHLDAMMIYRLDRFGRGGDHTPFNNAGFPAVRITEAHENYRHQHQDVRVEDGIQYGDLPEFMNFGYAAKITAVDAAALASLAWAPPTPDSVRIGGAVSPSTTLAWEPVDDPTLAGYKIYWRKTTAPQWQEWRFVPAGTTRHTLENMVIDNYFFGVAAIGENGNESPVVFPQGLIRD